MWSSEDSVLQLVLSFRHGMSGDQAYIASAFPFWAFYSDLSGARSPGLVTGWLRSVRTILINRSFTGGLTGEGLTWLLRAGWQWGLHWGQEWLLSNTHSGKGCPVSKMRGKRRKMIGTGVLKCHLCSGSLDTPIWDIEAVPLRPCLSIVNLLPFMLGDFRKCMARWFHRFYFTQ